MVGLYFTRLGVFLMKIMPFRLMYILSDFLCFLFIYIVQYRKKTILENLRNSFPEKSSAEINILMKGAYRNLCDILLEGVKGLSMTENEFRKRYVILNPEITFSLAEKNQSIILTGGHYTNWEYGVVSWCIWFRHKTIGIYKPLSNKKVEAFLNEKRSNLGMHLAATYDTRKTLEAHQNIASLYVLMGDQSPSNMKTTHWLSFLGQDTPWLHGVGTIANSNDFPIFYLDTQRIKRGFYESRLIPLVMSPKEHTPEEISLIYAQYLEKIIRQKPENWLWSHKRWKHKRVY